MRRTASLLAAFLLSLATALGAALGATALPAQGADQLPVPYQFLPSAILGGAKVNAPGTNDWTCKPSAAHPRPVVLVHGTAGNKSTNWATYGPLLKNHGYCVFALTYGQPIGLPMGYDLLGGLGDIKASAAELQAFVAKVRAATGASKVDLIGHSQGTFMPEYYVKYLGGASSVANYISLAPLWNGTGLGPSKQVSMLAAVFGTDELPLCPACSQMLAGSKFVAELQAGGLVVPGVTYTNIMTKYDELVRPYTSGIAPGMKNIVLQDHCALDFSEHFQIAADRNAAQFVLNTLDPAHATPIRCYLQLPFVGGL